MSDGFDAASGSIAGALQSAQQGFDANQKTIGKYSDKAQGSYDTTNTRALGEYSPMVQSGDAARTYYDDAIGINGQDKQNAFYSAFMKRPDVVASQNQAGQAVAQQYGDRLNSGAFARALQGRLQANMGDMVGQNLQQVAPEVQAGNQARNSTAAQHVNYGNQSAGNDWRTSDAYVGNQNFLTQAQISAAIAQAKIKMQQEMAAQQQSSSMMGGIGSILGALFG